jgi:Retrotransposon gag protein
MADPSILARARKARFDDLISFSGQPSEDVEQFLKSIKNITKATNESNNHELLEIVRGKLIQSAGIWFDNNEAKFKTWSDFEVAFRNRYLATTTTSKKFEQLKQRRQKPDELIINYCDEIINLCQEVDPKMSDLTIIQYLLSGLKTNVRKELSRRESAMNSLDEFLKYAKIEQDLNDTFGKFGEMVIDQQQPQTNWDHLSDQTTAAINAWEHEYRNGNRNGQFKRPMHTQSSDLQRNSNRRGVNSSQPLWNLTRNFSRRNDQIQKTVAPQANASQKNITCKICGRKNHRTINCFYKKPTGCFKCGQDHMIRDCTMLTNFQ